MILINYARCFYLWRNNLLRNYWNNFSIRNCVGIKKIQKKIKNIYNTTIQHLERFKKIDSISCQDQNF